MAAIVIVGSGASAVHFALSVLRRQHDVTMLDLGYEGLPPPLPEAGVNDLKEHLHDPAEYFLGRNYQAVIFPSEEAEYYGLPPSKDFVLEPPPGFAASARGFAPLFSFARGGFAEAWTAGCYPFDESELEAFPFSYADLRPHYDEVSRRIGITGCEDDLARFIPVHDNLLGPIDLDEHSRVLSERYDQHSSNLNRDLGFYLGRTRVATLTRDLGSRRACDYLGRCLWGCPSESLYTPSLTLRECLQYPGFSYRPGLKVKYFRSDSRNMVTDVVAESLDSGQEVTVPADSLVLAAGTLGSSAILLRSVYESTGEILKLRGLMDNLQALVPFVNLAMVGRQFRAASYQFHLLGLALTDRDSTGYVHGQITTLKAGVIHPIAQSLPLDLRTATYVTRNMRAALGVVNLNFADSRRSDNFLTLEHSAAHGEPQLSIRYDSAARSPAAVSSAVRRLKKALWKLGCIVPPGMMHIRPIGASVHYAGTLPMSPEPAPWTTDEDCRSHDFPNLFVVDGSTFPELPAKNITFTLMANAIRVAESVF